MGGLTQVAITETVAQANNEGLISSTQQPLKSVSRGHGVVIPSPCLNTQWARIKSLHLHCAAG